MLNYNLKLRSILFTVLSILLWSCQYDPHAHLYTTSQPQKEDIPGVYILDSYDFANNIPIEHHNVKLTLFPDGTFEATNIPPWNSPGVDTNFFSTLVSGRGKWEVSSLGTLDPGSKTIWGIYLRDSENSFHPANFSGDKPPYGLIFTLGDPDIGDAVILRKRIKNINPGK
ncbi:MAG: hypothetical protein ACTHLE_12790 [Agriterribacter sp.]